MFLKVFVFSFTLICSLSLCSIETDYAKKDTIEFNFEGSTSYNQFGVDAKFFILDLSVGFNWFFITSFYVGLDNGFSTSIGLSKGTRSTLYYAPKAILGKVWKLNALYLDLGIAYGITLYNSTLDKKLAKIRDRIEVFGYAKFILDQHSLIFIGPNINYENSHLDNKHDRLSIQIVIGYSLFF